ncbi:unnamed protein product [Amoebophrya sp. A120]|nr:unnamed protein product [Amoebophrya sp. A120]|eukprot:GSA120T00000685001.1
MQPPSWTIRLQHGEGGRVLPNRTVVYDDKDKSLSLLSATSFSSSDAGSTEDHVDGVVIYRWSLSTVLQHAQDLAQQTAADDDIRRGDEKAKSIIRDGTSTSRASLFLMENGCRSTGAQELCFFIASEAESSAEGSFVSIYGVFFDELSGAHTRTCSYDPVEILPIENDLGELYYSSAEAPFAVVADRGEEVQGNNKTVLIVKKIFDEPTTGASFQLVQVPVEASAEGEQEELCVIHSGGKLYNYDEPYEDEEGQMVYDEQYDVEPGHSDGEVVGQYSAVSVLASNPDQSNVTDACVHAERNKSAIDGDDATAAASDVDCPSVVISAPLPKNTLLARALNAHRPSAPGVDKGKGKAAKAANKGPKHNISSTHISQQLGYATRTAPLSTAKKSNQNTGNLPTTFHRKVRSAGYGQAKAAPPKKRFQRPDFGVPKSALEAKSEWGTRQVDVGQRGNCPPITGAAKRSAAAPQGTTSSGGGRGALNHGCEKIADCDYLDNLVVAADLEIKEAVMDLCYFGGSSQSKLLVLTSDNVVSLVQKTTSPVLSSSTSKEILHSGHHQLPDFAVKSAFSLDNSLGRVCQKIRTSCPGSASAQISANGFSDQLLLAVTEDNCRAGLYSLNSESFGKIVCELTTSSSSSTVISGAAATSTGTASNSNKMKPTSTSRRAAKIRDACFVANSSAIAAVVEDDHFNAGAQSRGTSGIGIFKYSLQKRDYEDDVNRFQQQGGSAVCVGVLRQRPVNGHQQPEQLQSCTIPRKYSKIASPSNVLSALLLASATSGANNGIHLWDLSHERIVATFSTGGADNFSSTKSSTTNETYSNAGRLTCMEFCTPSNAYSSIGNLSLFYTASTDGFCDLFDIRCKSGKRSSVASFSGCHKHSFLPHLKIKMSGCMRYLACGSEDGSVVLYDVRRAVTGSFYSFSDAISNQENAALQQTDASVTYPHTHTSAQPCSVVDFHPVTGTLTTGGFDKRVCFLKNAELLPVGTRKNLRRGGGARGAVRRKPGGGMRNFLQGEAVMEEPDGGLPLQPDVDIQEAEVSYEEVVAHQLTEPRELEVDHAFF